MERMLPRMAAVALLCAATSALSQTPDHSLSTLLDLSRPQAHNRPGGWTSNTDAARLETDAGERVLRLTRTETSPGEFSTVAAHFPTDLVGRTLTFTADLRTQDVNGYAALWLRADNSSQHLLDLKNSADEDFGGTQPWHSFSLSITLTPQTRQITFGVLLHGPGTAWVRHLQLWVDGKPAADAPVLAPEETALDRDTAFANGSRLQLTSLTDAQVENLATLGELWGFLKYHHPAITSGARNWDAELFRVLPKVLAARTRNERNAALLAWIDSLGPLKPCAPCATPPPASAMEPDIAWLHDRARFGPALSARLLEVYSHRSAPQFYVSKVPNIGNPSFDHEPDYNDMQFPDPGYQLLTLFRWWNVLAWWYPDRDLLPGLHATLRRYIRPIALAKDQHEFTLTTIKLIGEAHDSHANLASSLDQRPPVGSCRVPAQLRFLGQQLVVWDAQRTPLQRGDIIERVGDTAVPKLIADDLPFYTGSNTPARLRDLAQTITNGDCSPIDLHITRNGTPLTVQVTRTHTWTRTTHDRTGDTLQLLSPDVAYLKLSSFHQKDVPAYLRQIAGTRALIIDIRNYPSDFAPFALGGHLVTATTPFARFTGSDLANPGAFSVIAERAIQPLQPSYSGRVAILVDEVSQSQAEYTTMALRNAPDAIVVGSQTSGADGDFSSVPLPFGMRSGISGLSVFTHDGKQTQQVGIARDIEAIPTAAGIAAGRDEVLEAALRALLGNDVPDSEIQRMAQRDSTPIVSLH